MSISSYSYRILSVLLVPFAISASLYGQSVSGVLNRDVWKPVAGSQTTMFMESEAYFSTPSLSHTVNGLNNIWGNGSYGERVQGYFTPSVTAHYQFYVSATDSVRFMLGDNAFNTEVLVDVTMNTAGQNKGVSRSQTSEPRLLQAGQRYYIALIHKDGIGNGMIDVAWSYAGGAGLTNWTQEAGVTAAQSTEPNPLNGATNAIDGNNGGSNESLPKTLSFTNNEQGSWWQVDLGEDRMIDRIEVFNRDADWWTFAKRLSNYRIVISNEAGDVVLQKEFHTEGSYTRAVELWETGGILGSQVRIELFEVNLFGDHTLCLSEVKVLGRADSSAAYQPIGIIPSSVFSSYDGNLLDLDDDQLKDSWESEHGFDATQLQLGDYNPAADPDKDGMINVVESLNETNPFSADSLGQALTTEFWAGSAHYSVEGLILSDHFYQQPTRRYIVESTSYRDLEKNSAARLRGYITAPTSGKYTFWLSARDGAQLWLSTDETKYRKEKLAELGPEVGSGHGIHLYNSNLWDHFTSQVSHEVELEAGEKYFLEILAQRGHADHYHASVAWATPGQARVALPLEAVSSYVFETEDSDDDYLPDTWETQYGLNPLDNGFVDRVRQGERGDFDQDGLSNREEYLLGTDPAAIDTDGDGISDGDEVNAYGTIPTVSDAPAEQLVSSVDLSTYTSAGLNWTNTSEGLIPSSFRGQTTWNFSVPNDGFWSLNIATSLLGELYQHESVPVEISINGESIGLDDLVFGTSRDATLRVMTPYLTAGNHTITLQINNLIARRMVSVRSINVYQPSGVDLDGDGLTDWVQAILTENNTVRPYQTQSRVSPVCIEGTARSGAIINGSPTQLGISQNDWYVDFTLNEVGSTALSINFEASIEHTGQIEWIATDIAQGGALTVRKGDSLKLTSLGAVGENITVTPNAGTAGSAEQLTLLHSSALPFEFATAGKYTVSASNTTETLSVTVKKADIDPNHIKDMLSNSLSKFSYQKTDVNESLFYDGGDTLQVVDTDTFWNRTEITLAPGTTGMTRLLIRLYEDGPILAAQQVNLMAVSDALQNDLIETFLSRDFVGYNLIQSPTVIQGLPEGGYVVIRIFRSGVTFIDGTKEMVLRAEDLSNDIVNLQFLFPEGMSGGFCHYIQIYDRHGNHIVNRR